MLSPTTACLAISLNLFALLSRLREDTPALLRTVRASTSAACSGLVSAMPIEWAGAADPPRRTFHACAPMAGTAWARDHRRLRQGSADD